MAIQTDGVLANLSALSLVAEMEWSTAIQKGDAWAHLSVLSLAERSTETLMAVLWAQQPEQE